MKAKPEHPEDRRSRLAAQRWAKQRSENFIRSRVAKVKQLFYEFSDADATDMFRKLREQFWERY